MEANTHDISSIFLRTDQKSGEIVWPVNVSNLLEIQSLAVRETFEEREEKKVSPVEDNCSVEHTTSEHQAEITSDNLQNEEPTEASEKDCKCKEKIDMLLNRISALKKQLELEKFGV